MMLRQLRRWIEGLAPRGVARSTWADYTQTRGYADAELAAKRRIVEEFAARSRPGLLLDLGCNDGEFAQAALAAGAARVVGFDADPGALDRACERARRERLDFLPLYQDAVDPSPALGWRGRERASMFERAEADAVTALAFEHHVALGRNVPLDETVESIVGMAPHGLVEFVPKNDPTVQRMLALKGDIFPEYHQQAFEQALAARARIARREIVSATGRTLYEFER
jgi:ribosomal protein L11 methylase PrmA